MHTKFLLENMKEPSTWMTKDNNVSFVCDCIWGMDWLMDLLTTYTHDSELNAITTAPSKPFPSLLSLHQPFPRNGF
jgi:hypothetical protein